MGTWVRRTAALAAILAAALMAQGCVSRQAIADKVADELASQSTAREEDLDLAKDAAAFYLKLAESVLAEAPGHAGLSESAASGFVQYAYAFVVHEADVMEGSNAAAAERMRTRAAKLFSRGKKHALRALEAKCPGLGGRLASGEELGDCPGEEHAGLAYWAAAAWAGEISLSKDKPEKVAELPAAKRLAEKSHELNRSYANAGAATLLGLIEKSTPGGDEGKASSLLDEAAAGGGEAGAMLARAEAFALPAGDKKGFVELLNKALAAAERDQDRLGLSGQMVRRRAEWLLTKLDSMF